MTSSIKHMTSDMCSDTHLSDTPHSAPASPGGGGTELCLMENFSPQPWTLCTPVMLTVVCSHTHPTPWKAHFEPGKNKSFFLVSSLTLFPLLFPAPCFTSEKLHYTQKGNMSANQAESYLHSLEILPDRDIDKHASPEMTATVFFLSFMDINWMKPVVFDRRQKHCSQSMNVQNVLLIEMNN